MEVSKLSSPYVKIKWNFWNGQMSQSKKFFFFSVFVCKYNEDTLWTTDTNINVSRNLRVTELAVVLCNTWESLWLWERERHRERDWDIYIEREHFMQHSGVRLEKWCSIFWQKLNKREKVNVWWSYYSKSVFFIFFRSFLDIFIFKIG